MKKKSKYKRLPNGYGAIVHLTKKNLRNPYLAKMRVGTNPQGQPLYKTIGTFATYSEAFTALMNANQERLPPESIITFAEIYRRFCKEVLTLKVAGRTLSQSSFDGYKYAYQAVPQLHNKIFLNITAVDLQAAIEAAGGSASKQTKIKLLFSKLYQYADFLGLTSRNLAGFVLITKKDIPKRNPFTPEEVRQLWNMPQSRWRDCALIMLYTGLRVSELFTMHEITETYFRAGVKTEAGINRVVPIHKEIAPIIKKGAPNGNAGLMQHWFKRNLTNHTPHDCRRTFITRADECGVNPTASRQIVGHSAGDVHIAKYTQHTPEYLYAEIQKLKY